MSHWGAHCQCDSLPLTLTPGLRCQPGFSSVQKQVAQSAHPSGMGAVGCDPRAFTGLSHHPCWASGKLPGLLGLRATVRTWLSSPAGPPPGEDTGGAEDPGGCRNRPGGSGKSWWLVSGEDLGRTHLSEIPEPGARKEVEHPSLGDSPASPVRPTLHPAEATRQPPHQACSRVPTLHLLGPGMHNSGQNHSQAPCVRGQDLVSRRPGFCAVSLEKEESPESYGDRLLVPAPALSPPPPPNTQRGHWERPEPLELGGLRGLPRAREP